MAHYLTLYQRDNLSDNVIDIERYLLDVSLVRERPDAPDHLTSPIAVVYYPFHRAARCVQFGSFAVEPAQTGLRVGDDAGERLVHFMGDRGRQFAQRRHARYACELHLCIEEALFAGAQLLFPPLALGNVVEKDSNASGLGVFDSEGVNVIPAFELFGFIFKSHRLAREGDPAVNFEPMFFVLRRDFAHPSAGGIFDSRLPFKRRVDLQKTIIDRLLVLVKQNFNRAKTLVNRFEQHAVILFRLAQFHLGPFAFGQVDHEGNAFVWLPLEKRAGDQNRYAAAVFAKVLFLPRLEGSNRL